MTSDGETWSWEFRPSAMDAFRGLESDVQQRIVTKLDNIVDDPWRDPPDYVEPLAGQPHGKVRVGAYRLGALADRDSRTLVIYDIEHRSGAYEPGDD